MAAACGEGSLSRVDIAELFQVSTTWIRRLLQRRRDSGSLQPRPHAGGHPPALDAQRCQCLAALVAETPDAALAGDIVVMDNLSTHKGAWVAAALAEARAEVWYLPPYAPDYNPIEPMWAKVKGWLRGAAARTGAALERAIGCALGTITGDDCHGYSRHRGYAATSE